MIRTSHLGDLLDLLDAVSTPEAAPVLLPSVGAAGELRRAFDRRQQERGRQAWYPAPALAWSQWMDGLWSEVIVAGADDRILLNPLQEQSLWNEIIAADPATSALTSPAALAQMARSAWALASAYQATGRLRDAAVTQDNRIFAGWTAAFSQRCAARRYLAAAQLEDALGLHLSQGTVSVPERLHLAGFVEFTPAREALIRALEDRGTVVVHHQLQAESDAVAAGMAAAAATEREELVLTAHWIREFLIHEPPASDPPRQELPIQEFSARPSPQPDLPQPLTAAGLPRRVTVLVPRHAQDSLMRSDGELAAVFRQILAPELQSVDADLSSQPWEMASGPPLASLPVISAALDVARWLESPLPIERVSALLRSPYLGDGDPTHAGTSQEAVLQFDSRVLRRNAPLRPEIGLAGLVALLDSRESRRLCPGARTALRWPGRLHAFLQRHGDLNRPRSFADWTEFVRETLRTVQWPSLAANSSLAIDAASRQQTESSAATQASDPSPAEFAAMQAWDSTLDLVATLDFSGRRVTFAAFREALQQEAERAALTLPSTGAPILVMGLEESAGCWCDAAVVLRATAANWPAGEHAHPLLPWPLQRSLGMPGADPAQTAARALSFATDLRNRSSSLLCTYALEDRDGALRPSPLLADLGLPTCDLRSLVEQPAPAEIIPAETCSDDTVLAAPPEGRVPGGARVLQLQAACGFRAFAELRLRATEPDGAEIGLDARESGNVLHHALQSFWEEVRSQDRLRSMTPLERRELLARCVDSALRRSAHPDSPWDNAYLAVQKDRQLSLLGRWLDQELARGPFTVLEVEQDREIDIGPLRLSLRVDRMDQVQDGIVLVDYKTGAAADPSLWEGERPDEPQLPLYALLGNPEELKGLAFARVRAGRDMRWNGLQTETGIFPGRVQDVEDLHARVAGWRDALTRLAEDFHAGRAEVRPKVYPKNCAHCAQRLLCRLDPATLLELACDDPETDPDAADLPGWAGHSTGEGLHG